MYIKNKIIYLIVFLFYAFNLSANNFLIEMFKKILVNDKNY